MFEKDGLGHDQRLMSVAAAAMVMRDFGDCRELLVVAHERRFLMIQAKVRSTTHLRRRTAKPTCSALRFTTSRTMWVRVLAQRTSRPA